MYNGRNVTKNVPCHPQGEYKYKTKPYYDS